MRLPLMIDSGKRLSEIGSEYGNRIVSVISRLCDGFCTSLRDADSCVAKSPNDQISAGGIAHDNAYPVSEIVRNLLALFCVRVFFLAELITHLWLNSGRTPPGVLDRGSSSK